MSSRCSFNILILANLEEADSLSITPCEDIMDKEEDIILKCNPVCFPKSAIVMRATPLESARDPILLNTVRTSDSDG